MGDGGRTERDAEKDDCIACVRARTAISVPKPPSNQEVGRTVNAIEQSGSHNKLDIADIVAVILFQTLFFKFTGAEESKYVFMKAGVELWGRVGSGILELIGVILLLIPSTVTV